ncbi:MAG: hypothetical protein M3Q97_02365 [Bacteroidota bacterium]|nr:hypothetical protein [Bacteroidota bacterium]
MKYFFLLLLITCSLAPGYGAPPMQQLPDSTDRTAADTARLRTDATLTLPYEMPNFWVNRALDYNSTLSRSMAMSFFWMVYPAIAKNIKESDSIFTSTTGANIDYDWQQELLMYIGLKQQNGEEFNKILVFDKIADQWQVVFEETQGSKFYKPFTQPLKADTVQKVFYYTEESSWSASLNATSTAFFKLLDGRVVPALSIMSKLYNNRQYGIFGETLHATSEHKVMGGDSIQVKYKYYVIMNEDAINTSLINDSAVVMYYWNKDSLEYLPRFRPGAKLNNAKILSMTDWAGNTTYYMDAFAPELERIRKKGTKDQKKALKKLKKAKKN